jgi:ParB family chromosome partitioning protein
MPDSLKPTPAIVQTGKAEASLAELARQINAHHEAGERCRREGPQHYRACGEALLKAKKLVGHGRWMKWLEKNVRCSYRQAERYMRLAKFDVTSNLTEEENLAEGWRIINGNADDEPAERAARFSHNAGTPEWYTPVPYIEAARAVLGGEIDLDPASSEKAQETVRAKKYYTLEHDGLSQDWAGRVWLNPPYTSGVLERFVGRLCKHVQQGNPALLLVNNATETRWFRQAAELASAICFPTGRIPFLGEEGLNVGPPLQGQAVLYFGNRIAAFATNFGPFGFWVKVRRA